MCDRVDVIERQAGRQGACGGECACSTCHVILEQEAFDKLEEQDDDEASSWRWLK